MDLGLAPRPFGFETGIDSERALMSGCLEIAQSGPGPVPVPGFNPGITRGSPGDHPGASVAHGSSRGLRSTSRLKKACERSRDAIRGSKWRQPLAEPKNGSGVEKGTDKAPKGLKRLSRDQN